MIITLAMITSVLGIDITESNETDINFLVSWAQSRAESLIGRSLELSERTEYLDGNGKHTLILPVIPVHSITSISIDNSRAFLTTENPSDYYCDLKSGILNFDFCVPPGHGNVKVVFNAGYNADSLPFDLKMALIECISWNFGRINNKAFGISNRNSPDGVGFSYEMVLPLGAQRVFELYRDVRV